MSYPTQGRNLISICGWYTNNFEVPKLIFPAVRKNNSFPVSPGYRYGITFERDSQFKRAPSLSEDIINTRCKRKICGHRNRTHFADIVTNSLTIEYNTSEMPCNAGHLDIKKMIRIAVAGIHSYIDTVPNGRLNCITPKKVLAELNTIPNNASY